jgi:hypothetical protein
MIYRIVEYIQPWEIDDLERQINQMILSTYQIKNDDKIIWDITLNISDDIVDWVISTLPKQYFIDKYNYLKTKAEHYFITEFDMNSSIQGCTDKRRSIQNKNQDYIIWLDSDVFFSTLTLPYLINSTKLLNEPLYILTPEIIKYWDESWDVITHNKFLNEPFNHRDYFDSYSLDSLVYSNDIAIKKNKNIKFGGGWFNLFTSEIFKLIPIPEELGSYASDDYYLSICSKIIKIPQYIVEGVVVTEIGNKFLENKDYIKPYLNIKLKDRNRVSNQIFNNLIQEFHNKNQYDNILCLDI